MEIQKYVGNPRITDYSFALAESISKMTSPSQKTLVDLYSYQLSLCTGPDALYPQSNWQPHRLCLMSSIAVKLGDTKRIQECEKFLLAWPSVSDCTCCPLKSQDYHFRDSLEYVVYGWWALATAFVYLQSFTKKKYKYVFQNLLNAFQPYVNGSKTHVEFLKSKYMPQDKSKPSYNKKFNPEYFQKTFLPVYNKLIG